jgi:hypothetical protein
MLDGDSSSRLRRLAASGVDVATVLDSEAKLKQFYTKYLEPGIDAYQEVGNRGEEINRAALYKQLVGKGMSHVEASFLARDLMDFSMQGAWATVRFLNQTVPFLNARLQGLYKLGVGAQENPARFSAVVGTVAIAAIGLMLAYKDDEDWKKREDWDRNTNLWFKLGGVTFRIPKPFEVGAIATLAERGLELWGDKEMTGKRFYDNVKAVVADNLSLNPIPQAFKPILDIYSNKDSFTGRPIESMGMERLRPEYRYNSGTSMLSRGVSTASLGALSPVQIDHLVRGYFGWLGTFVVSAGDMIARSMSNEPARPTSDIWKIATQGMVTTMPEPQSRYVTQMYNQAKELEQAYGTFNDLIKRGRVDEAKTFVNDNKKPITQYGFVEAIKKEEAKFNELIRIVENSKMTPEVKRAKIDQIKASQNTLAQKLDAALH